MHELMKAIEAHRIIAIVRGLAPDHMLGLAEALYAGGIRMMEVTFDQTDPAKWPQTEAAIRLLRDHFGGRILPGAGTVMTPDQVARAHDAGARYIISPHVDAAVIAKIKMLGMLSLPGALSPTEIANAWRAGADAVKVFPAGCFGPGYLRAIKAPLAHIPMLAVGGITTENAQAFLQAGAIGLGVGGLLVNHAWIEAGDWAQIQAQARALADAVGLSET